MRIISVSLTNIKAHTNRTFTFAPGINVVSGPNGVGKSTLFEAIGYALFGVDARDFVGNSERFISIGSKKGSISVTFEACDGNQYQITRTVGTPARWLLSRSIMGTFEVEEHANSTETEQRLRTLLGLQGSRRLADQFKLVIGPFQSEFLGPFIERKQTKRQEAFDEILGVDTWRTTYKGTAELVKALQTSKELLMTEIRFYGAQLEHLPGIRVEIANVITAQEAARHTLGQISIALTGHQTALKELDDKEQAIGTITSDIQRLSERIADGLEKIADKQKQVHASELAVQIIADNQAGFQAYEETLVRLQALRAEEQAEQEREKAQLRLEHEYKRLQQACDHEARTIEQDEIKRQEALQDIATALSDIHAVQSERERLSALPLLTSQLDSLTTQLGQLHGRREGLLEGQRQIAEGICPFLLEHCHNLAGEAPEKHFSDRLYDIDRALLQKDHERKQQQEALAALQEIEKAIHASDVRRQELILTQQQLESNATPLEHRRAALKKMQSEADQAALVASRTKQTLVGTVEITAQIQAAEAQCSALQQHRDAVITNTRDAQAISERRDTVTIWLKALQTLQQEHANHLLTLGELQNSYDNQQHQLIRNQRDTCITQQAVVAQQINQLETETHRLQTRISELESIEQVILDRNNKVVALDRQLKLVSFLRDKIFRQVSDQVARRFRQEISRQADLLYRTIANTDEELHWGDNYQITLKDMHEGFIRERSDDQLSGGQMMSAVVALRLALLQTIGARLAFFDEPTSSLDVTRRENLAQAFRALDQGRHEVQQSWYDQLFLISHDSSFTEITDQIVLVAPEACQAT